MKKIISAIIILSILASQAVLAAPSLLKDYIFSDGEYLYTFGNIEKNSDIDELGVKINGENYKLEDNKLPMAKLTGKFGIGIKDSGNLLGASYSVAPYTAKDENETVGEAIELVKEASVRNLKYHGPAVDGFDSAPVLENILKTGTQIYTNVDAYLLNNVHADLKGEQYISIFNPVASTVDSEIKKAWTTSSPMEWISFDLYESAVVKVFTKDAYAGLTSEVNGFTHYTAEDNGGAYFTLLHKDYPNADQHVFANMYTKEYNTENGCARVSLPNLTTYGGLSHWGYLIVIDYIGDEETEPMITNVSYAGPQVEGVTYGVKLNHVLSSDKEKMVYANNSEISFANVDSSIAGNPYIIMDNVKGSKYNSELAAAWFGGARDWITFEINSDATIKVISDGDTLKNCGSYGFTKSEEDATYFEAYNNTWNTSEVSHKVMYYKNVEVEPGETVKVVIPNAPTWTTQATCKRAHVVVIDFEREYVLQPEITNVTYKGPAVEGVTYNLEVAGNLANGSKAYTNYDYYFGSLDASILGKDYIIMDSPNKSDIDATVKAAWDGGATDWYTFEINKSARIKVITDGNTLKNCGKYSYTKCEDTVEYFKTVNSEGAVNRTYNVMYYKDVEVPYGKTVTVTVLNAPTWTGTCKWGHVVVVDYDSFGK